MIVYYRTRGLLRGAPTPILIIMTIFVVAMYVWLGFIAWDVFCGS